ncbi:MAG: hypothetical protein WA839_14390, partial [Flavobacteriaceae bacterium]
MKTYYSFFKALILFICFAYNSILIAQNESIKLNDNHSALAYKAADSLYNNRNYVDSEKKLHSLIKTTDTKNQADILYKSYKLLGLINSSSQKLDSSSYYFKTSLEFLERSSETELEKKNISGFTKNNIALNMFNTGKTEKSIETLNDAIFELYEFISETKDKDKKNSATKKRLACIDNLAGFYRGVGENQRAIDLLTYSYEQKQKILPKDDSGLVISRLLLGHIHLIARNYNQAGAFVDKGIEYIDKIPFAKSYAYLVRASIYENIGDLDSAKRFYEMCEAVYRENFDGKYSRAFLDGLVEMSIFYTKLDMDEKALNLAKEGYNYTHKDTYQNDLLSFYQTQNLSLIYFLIEDYKKSLKYSNEALSFFENRNLNTVLD